MKRGHVPGSQAQSRDPTGQWQGKGRPRAGPLPPALPPALALGEGRPGAPGILGRTECPPALASTSWVTTWPWAASAHSVKTEGNPFSSGHGDSGPCHCS